MNETNQAPATGGTKLSTIFMVVLGLHIVVIVVISAFYFMKGRSHPEMADATTPATTETTPAVAADLNTPAADTTSTQPVVETNTAPQISQEMIDTMASTGPESPMPSSSDPAWATTPAEAPDQADVQPNLAANLQTPPARLEPKVAATKPVTEVPLIAPAKKAAVASTTPSKAKTYTVVAGDNLTKVAKKNSTTVAQLKKANALTSDSLKIGQALKVPGSTAVAATPAPAAPAKKSAPVVAASPASTSTYQVVKGDTLWKIAKSYGVSPNALAQTNGLNDPKDLKVGATLKIPRSAAKAAAKPAPVREAEASAPVTKFREPVITMDMARL